MTPEEEKKIIKGWSDQAIQHMQKHSISMLPENYYIWFEYVRGGNKKLKEAIEKAIEDKKDFNHDLNREIYSNFILKETDSKIVVETGSRIKEIMSNVLKTIESSSGDTENYNKELDSFTKDLTSTGNGDLTKVVSSLIAKTVELKNKGTQLQQKLNESKQEVESLKVNLEHASAQASMDALTGISNRKAFDDKIEQLMHEARTKGTPLCLLMVDVDHFKKFNDTYGHLIGDQVLKIVALAIKEVVKGRDIVARYGGEEFAVVLPETPLKGGEIVAETIRKAIASKELKRKDTGASFGTITVSIGVTGFNRVSDKAETMIERADRALYASKTAGRNRVTVEE